MFTVVVTSNPAFLIFVHVILSDTRKDDANGEIFTRTVDSELRQLSLLAATKPENVHILFSDSKCNGLAFSLRVSIEISVEEQLGVSGGIFAKFPYTSQLESVLSYQIQDAFI
jgi:hypothetical protein